MGRGRVHPAQVTGLTHRWATIHIHGHVHTHIPTCCQFKTTTMNACFWTVGGSLKRTLYVLHTIKIIIIISYFYNWIKAKYCQFWNINCKIWISLKHKLNTDFFFESHKHHNFYTSFWSDLYLKSCKIKTSFSLKKSYFEYFLVVDYFLLWTKFLLFWILLGLQISVFQAIRIMN